MVLQTDVVEIFSCYPEISDTESYGYKKPWGGCGSTQGFLWPKFGSQRPVEDQMAHLRPR